MKPLMMAVIVAAVYVEAGAAAIGGHQYIARKSLFVQPNASAPAPIKDVVVQLGGQVDFDLPRWLIMTIPDSALQTIREHPAVKYLQQVVSGPFVEPTSTATTARRVSTNTRVAANSLPPWTSGTYKYDGAGNIWAIGNDTFTYDSLSRLATANVKGVSETYTYDAFGNLIQKTTGSLTVGLPTDTATNHLTEQSYDAAGNLIGDSSETNAFDPVNMQREKDIPGASLAELYVYDASDERIGVIQCSGPPASCTDGKETWTFRDESGKVLRQYEGTSVGSGGFSFPNSEGAWAWIEDYVYRDNLLLAAELQPEEGGRRHFHLDHLGTARLVTGSAGQQLAQHDYYPFGVEIPPSFPETSAGYDREEPMRFTGHERDFNVGTTTENSNYNDFMHARATIPQWGRFLSVDQHSGKSGNPQSWNRYSYALNQPLRFVDADGRDPISFLQNFILGIGDLRGALIAYHALHGSDPKLRFPLVGGKAIGSAYAYATGTKVGVKGLEYVGVDLTDALGGPGTDNKDIGVTIQPYLVGLDLTGHWDGIVPTLKEGYLMAGPAEWNFTGGPNKLSVGGGSIIGATVDANLDKIIQNAIEVSGLSTQELLAIVAKDAGIIQGYRIVEGQLVLTLKK